MANNSIGANFLLQLRVKVKTPRSFLRGGLCRRSPRISSSADARQFFVVLDVDNLELFGVHAGVGAE
jgi:hypothetical protein